MCRSTARATASGRSLAARAGFTLVEMMVVMAIIVTILSIAIPFYQASLIRAKEAVLRSNLFTMRSVIDQYTYDKERPPQSLQEIVDEGYLREVPVDPFTESRETWQVIVDSSTPGGESGVWNVKSGSNKSSLEGTPYSEW
ncbi:MAG: prepilin-type N-terminal cleavage/methylation domain-containing protein [Bryobacterales bacterium]